MESKVLIPVRQLLVLFHGYQILAVLLPDNRVAVSLRALCRMLNVARNGQMQRIRRDKNLSQQLLLARVETSRGPRPMEVLVVEAIRSFHRAFFKEDAEPAAKTARKRSSQPDEWVEADGSNSTLDSPYELLYAALDDAKRAIRGIEREQGQTETQIGDRFARIEKYESRVEARLAQLEQRAGQTSDSEAEQAAPDNERILSPLHLVQVSVLARSLRARTGERIDAMMADLAETFGVEDVSDIPDAGWEHVRSWFWQRSQRQDHQL